MALALNSHAAMEIFNYEDLESVKTLGFRGEALAGIGTVPRLTLISNATDSPDEGHSVNTTGHHMEINILPKPCLKGTVVEVEDIFNTPARQQIFEKERTEFNHIDEIFRRIALVSFYGYRVSHIMGSRLNPSVLVMISLTAACMFKAFRSSLH